MTMKLMRWAIALTAIGLTPVTVGAQTPTAAAPQAAATPTVAAPAPAEIAAPGAAPVAAPAPAPSIAFAAPTPGIGIPDGRKGIQDQVTEIGRDAALEGLECPPYKAATFEACQGWRLVAKPIRVG